MYQNVISVCSIRKAANLTCRDCIYYGGACDKIKHKYKIDSPLSYNQLISKSKGEQLHD